MSSQNNISTKICVYGCGLNLYWNTSTKEYWEVFTKKKHICPNRSSNASLVVCCKLISIKLINLKINWRKINPH